MVGVFGVGEGLTRGELVLLCSEGERVGSRDGAGGFSVMLRPPSSRDRALSASRGASVGMLSRLATGDGASWLRVVDMLGCSISDAKEKMV